MSLLTGFKARKLLIEINIHHFWDPNHWRLIPKRAIYILEVYQVPWLELMLMKIARRRNLVFLSPLRKVRFWFKKYRSLEWAVAIKVTLKPIFLPQKFHKNCKRIRLNSFKLQLKRSYLRHKKMSSSQPGVEKTTHQCLSLRLFQTPLKISVAGPLQIFMASNLAKINWNWFMNQYPCST